MALDKRLAGNAPLKGRGAVGNPQHRFDALTREAFDDGWSLDTDAGEATAALRTQITEELAKSILTRNQSPDLPFGLSLNPYRGCEHGCTYCYARPTHSYLNLSPGLDFEARIFAKVNAPELLSKALSRPDYRCEPIAFGVNTDAYQPVERRYRITRRLLEVCEAFGQPVGLITKSARIENDLDILVRMASRRLVHVTMSITTLDSSVSRSMEPRTSAPARRVETVRRLAAAGIPVSVNVAPIVPFLTDHELERILETVAEVGAEGASYIVLRLPWEVLGIFGDWLEAHFPLKAAHVMSRVKALRDGKANDPRFGSRMTGEGVYADLLRQRFETTCRRLGLDRGGRQRMRTLDVTRFKAPSGQQDLF
ncbi:MAG: PA0069 family radical SAM protein [Betaproteobacteria bacterium]|nr:PA0069 family radical SAM protein [Betaproteobacteria bacterium]